MALIQSAVNSVSECDPLLQSFNSSILSNLPFRIVCPANRSDQALGQWPVLIVIEFNVPMQVILKLVKFSANVSIELVDDLLEEIGEKVFATEEKRRRDRAKIASLNDGESVFDKSPCCIWNIFSLQSGRQ